MKPYLIRLHIRAFTPCHIDAINTRVLAEWHFRCQSIEMEPPCIEWVGDGLLALGEAAFAERIAQVVWIANHGPCEIVMQLCNLSLAPFTTIRHEASDHARWLATHTDPILSEVSYG